MKIDRNIMVLTHDFLTKNIVDRIEMHQSNILNSINYALIRLFWDLGTIIQNHLESTKVNEQQYLNDIVVILEPQFGNYFSQENLTLMKNFANRCPASVKDQIAPHIQWEYIPMLIHLESDQAWLFYARLILQERLTPKQLEEKIAKKQFEKIGLKLKIPQFPFSDLFSISVKEAKPAGARQYFEGEKAKAFRMLLEPADSSAVNNNVDLTQRSIITDLFSRIIAFQIDSNTLYNISFNNMFRSIGQEIIRLFETFEHDDKEENMIIRLSKQTEKQFGSLFDHAQIHNSITFARQYTIEDNRVHELVGTVQWEHIKILLKIDDVNAQLFYARLVLRNGLSTTELKEHIVKNAYLAFADDGDKPEPISMGNDPEEREIKKGSKKLRVTFTALEEPEYSPYDINRNIFKNPDLIAFLKTF